MPALDLPTNSRIAIVTGASQGIGRNIALRLADDGLDVAVNDIPTKSAALKELVVEIRAKGRRALAIEADVSKEDEVAAMVTRVAQELGGLDVMVANAGIMLVKSILETSADELDRTNAINIRGTLLSYKYAAKQMIEQGRGGRIIGEWSFFRILGSPMLAAYSASKFAVRGLTQSAAREFAPYNITVNSFAPGIIKTAMVDHQRNHTRRKLRGKLPAMHLNIAEPEVIASLVSYLVRPESYFITGEQRESGFSLSH
ncbi:NAD(P)-binding protein [Wolfiporia cocos MD-104 SS10]|uniref:NAD(P)-binding protein n=1 Tax=Wolfiporia cocos (strain MD-104) TaxID=742152 RepID=A0A2H3JSE2_WOLCO|nr:NAD(P)-binding protein [Wolfiporia cocos MD-104 SS10]